MSFPSPTKKYNHEPTPVTDPSRPELSVAGKSVVVTGAGTGVGIAIATAFATAGAKHIVLTGRRVNLVQETAKKIGSSFPKTKSHALQSDVTSEKDIEDLFDYIGENVGAVDIFVNNAGYLTPPGPLIASDTADWWTSFEINIKGTYLTAKAFANQVHESKGSPIFISIGTGAAHVGPSFGPLSAYASSKLGSNSVVQYLQAENPNMKAFSVSPGLIKTDMSAKGRVPDEMALDTVELPAHFCVWLAGPESDFLKGKFLWANWDVDELKAMKDKIEADPSSLQITLAGWPSFSTLA